MSGDFIYQRRYNTVKNKEQNCVDWTERLKSTYNCPVDDQPEASRTFWIKNLFGSIKGHCHGYQFLLALSTEMVCSCHCFYVFISYILVMLARFCAILLFLCTPVSPRIFAFVLQLYERNKARN